jgi:hypothetical protein
MNHSERLRRTLKLCCHCLRNLAFYRAGWRGSQFCSNRQFLINANSNCLDIAVLEWCKLFADRDGKHHWKQLISNDTEFIYGLCKGIGISNFQFRKYASVMLRYRNKFVAHLDDDRVAQIPRLRIARKSTAYLYDYLRGTPEAKTCLPDLKEHAKQYYEFMYRNAHNE